jgi:hypothetical protein
LAAKLNVFGEMAKYFRNELCQDGIILMYHKVNRRGDVAFCFEKCPEAGWICLAFRALFHRQRSG